jgi:hypothetical protein
VGWRTGTGGLLLRCPDCGRVALQVPLSGVADQAAGDRAHGANTWPQPGRWRWLGFVQEAGAIALLAPRREPAGRYNGRGAATCGILGRPMAGHGEKLTRKQEQAVAALLGKATLAEAAAEAGVSERALRGWMKDPGFSRAYAEARRAVLEASIGRLQQATGEAVETLRACLQAKRDSDRIRAAVAILDQALKGAELMDLAGRLEELERGLAPEEVPP